MEELGRDKEFRALLEAHKGKVDPENLFNQYKHSLEGRAYEIYDHVGILKKELASLENEFGKKPLSVDCMKDIMRYNRLTELIRVAETPKEEL